ncbi:MAG: hypothetical protein EZS28_029016, partial [Streblomastix strix]
MPLKSDKKALIYQIALAGFKMRQIGKGLHNKQ